MKLIPKMLVLALTAVGQIDPVVKKQYRVYCPAKLMILMKCETTETKHYLILFTLLSALFANGRATCKAAYFHCIAWKYCDGHESRLTGVTQKSTANRKHFLRPTLYKTKATE